MSPTLTHLALHVPDLDACIAFYETFCGMRVIHRRPGKGSQIVWMAEPGQEQRFIFVIMPGGQPRNLASDDYSHFGFALSSRAAVDDLARRAEAAGNASSSSSCPAASRATWPATITVISASPSPAAPR
ncbi:VOC family protein, partial [Pseudomonas aeruginosa]